MYVDTIDRGPQSKIQGGVTSTYAYSGAGLLREAKEGSTARAQYFYDALGRGEATEEGVTTFFAYGLGLDPLWTTTGTTETRHVTANGMRIAKTTPSGAVQYFLADHPGSTRKVLDASRNTGCSTDYERFGKPVAPTGTETYKFTMEKYDDPTGLVYLRARQYDPEVGRFVSADPVLGLRALHKPGTATRTSWRPPVRHHG